MSADSEKPNIIGGNWTKYCTVAKSVGRGRPIWRSVVVCARVACALRPVQSHSGRHILESRCAERCANDAFSTSFRAGYLWQHYYTSRCGVEEDASTRWRNTSTFRRSFSPQLRRKFYSPVLFSWSVPQHYASLFFSVLRPFERFFHPDQSTRDYARGAAQFTWMVCSLSAILIHYRAS